MICKCYEDKSREPMSTMLKEFDSDKSYSWHELSLMTEVCASCGKEVNNE